MNLFENLQTLKESENNNNYNLNALNAKYFISETIKILTDIRKQILVPEHCKSVYDIYQQTLELQAMFNDNEEIKTEAPKEFFNKVTKAKETLSHFTVQQVNFVKKAYEEVLADISDSFISERGTNMTQIKNDYISIAIEDNLMTAEEFETIFKALEVIGVFYSHANA